MFGRRLNSNQARICVLQFSANRVWLVSRFYTFYIIIFYNITKHERTQYQRLTLLDYVRSGGRVVLGAGQ